jgi:N-glycosylase/DNA lyase
MYTTEATHATLVALPVPTNFRLDAVVQSHGWYDLPPFNRGQDGSLGFVAVIDGQPVACAVRESRGAADSGLGGLSPAGPAIAPALELEIFTTDPPSPAAQSAALAAARAVLALDWEIEPFLQLTDGDPSLAWVRAAGGGRLLRAPTVFEDLTKLVCTTNCTWDATRRMVVALVEHLGPITPGGRRGFPSPADMAAAPESFYRDVARAGYRARSLRELAEKAAREPEALERLREVTWPSSALRRALLELHGVGPYAAEHLLRLLGRHDYLALDSWCRPKFAELRGARGPVSDARIARTYARYGAFQGLALWLDLTRDWSCYVAHSGARS